MSHSTIVAIAVIALIALLILLYLLRGRKQHVSLGEPARTAPAPLDRSAAPPPPPDMGFDLAGKGVAAEATAAIEDVVDQFIGTDAHPSGVRSGDTLTLLKGLGPRAATLLGELGVTRFDQIAGWSEADAARIDAHMGAFKGRIARDRWVEQARLLAAGDRQGFEAQFGKIGG